MMAACGNTDHQRLQFGEAKRQTLSDLVFKKRGAPEGELQLRAGGQVHFINRISGLELGTQVPLGEHSTWSSQQASAKEGLSIVGLDETFGGRDFHRLRYYGDLPASVSRTPMQEGEEHYNFHCDMGLGAPIAEGNRDIIGLFGGP